MLIIPPKKSDIRYLISDQPNGSRKVKYLQPSIHEFTPLEILKRQDVTYKTQATPHKKDPIQFPKNIKT